MKIKFIVVISILTLVFASCSNSDLDEINLYDQTQLLGVWTDTVPLQPRGYIINSLIIRENMTFNERSAQYGTNSSRPVNELAAYTEHSGNFVLSDRNHIRFASKQRVDWNSATASTPVTSIVDEGIFESCTFKVSTDSLMLTYISYPNDAPATTTRKYVRSKTIVE